MSIWEDPAPSQEEIDEIVRNPFEWLKRKQEELNLQGKKKYFITFTKRDEINSEKFKKRIAFELQRKHVVSFKVCFEHEDQNLHAHALVESNKYLRKNDTFKTYMRNYGFVDLQKVRNEAAVDLYLQKENSFHDKIDFI